MTAREGTDRLRVLVDTGIAINSELSLDGVLERIVEAAARVTDASYAALGVIDLWSVPASAGVLVQAAHVGVAIVVGVLVFVISALILRVGEVDDLKEVVVRRFRA